MPSQDFFAASLDKTLRAVFLGVRIHASGNDNVFFVASQSADMRLRNSPDPSTVHPSCRGDVIDAIATIVETDPAHGIVLTERRGQLVGSITRPMNRMAPVGSSRRK